MIPSLPTYNHQNPRPEILSGELLGAEVIKIQKGVTEVLEKMKKQEEILKEKRDLIEKIAVICEEPENDIVASFAEILRETGDVNARLHEWTVLMNALCFGHMKIIKLLLEHPDIGLNESVYDGVTVLVWAAHYAHIDNIKLILNDSRLNLKEHNQGKKALEEAREEEVRVLIEAKMREQGIDI